MTQALAQARKALEAIVDTLDAEEMGEGPPASQHVAHWQKLHEYAQSALAAIDAALEGGAVPKDGDSHRTVFAWAWTLFGNGSIWLRALTWTKDDPFAVEVANPNFTSVAVPLYTDEELSAALPSALDLPSPPTGA